MQPVHFKSASYSQPELETAVWALMDTCGGEL